MYTTTDGMTWHTYVRGQLAGVISLFPHVDPSVGELRSSGLHVESDVSPLLPWQLWGSTG